MAVFTGNGSAASPSLTFSSDTDTGVYQYSTNILGFAAGGASVGAWNTTGKLTLFGAAAGEVLSIQSTTTVNNASSNTNYLRFYDSAGAQGYVGYAGTQATFSIAGGTSQTINIASNLATTFTNSGITAAKFAANEFVGGTNDGVSGQPGGNYIIRGAYAGTGTDLAGGSLSLFAGRGTGNSTASLLFYTWQQQASGTTNQPSQLAGGFYQTGVAAGSVFRLSSASLGIQFNGDTAAANALDDYEQGTFTPTIAGQTVAGTGTYSTQLGYYTKIGDLVWFNINIAWSAHTGSGNMLVSGLPFTVSAAASGNSSPVAWRPNNIALTAGNIITGYCVATTNYILVQEMPTGGGAASNAAFDTAGDILVSGVYKVV